MQLQAALLVEHLRIEKPRSGPHCSGLCSQLCRTPARLARVQSGPSFQGHYSGTCTSFSPDEAPSGNWRITPDTPPDQWRVPTRGGGGGSPNPSLPFPLPWYACSRMKRRGLRTFKMQICVIYIRVLNRGLGPNFDLTRLISQSGSAHKSAGLVQAFRVGSPG